MADKLDDKGFLQRWSARKAEARTGGDVAPEHSPVSVPGDATESEDAPKPNAEPAPAPDLPDVETLDADSDYTGFLGDNVPLDVTKLALRKLWRSDPVLANLDGLNDYDEDFSAVGMRSEVVKTIYQVGKGLLTDAEEHGDGEPDEEAVVADSEVPTEVAENEARENSASGSTKTDHTEGESAAEEFHNVEFPKPD